MPMTRREVGLLPLALSGCGGGPSDARKGGWPASWDRILVEKYVRAESELFDPKEQMVTRLLGAEYRYHTKLREQRVHPTRESLDYALGLLEIGGNDRLDRARLVIGRVLGLQVRDPKSEWYGIWGWYMEEPPDRMAPADWNWADFNGAALLLIDLRHGAKLPDELRARTREAILHAAWSVMRRNVSMSYTNIAAMGTFVTLAAGEMLGNHDLMAYARERVQRLARAIDETGSFEEYNSPTYARVTLVNLARIRMYVKDEASKRTAARIEERLWRHLAARWDAPRMQFAGPMSRCYSTDLGSPMWLDKGLQGRLGAVREQMLTGDLDTGIHDLRCPESVSSQFLNPELPRQVREVFVPGREGERPVQGTTYLTKEYSLGSINRGDFWTQRRPLLAYWGDASRPARNIQMRLIKDGYDFASALLFSVQQQNCVLGLVNFRNPGGNRHISLDPIKDGAFESGRLWLELDFEGLGGGQGATLDGDRLSVESGQLKAVFEVRGGRFGSQAPRLKLTPAANSVVLTVDLLPEGGPHQVKWSAVGESWLLFTLALGAATGGECRFTNKAGVIEADWASPAGRLGLRGSSRVAPVEEQVHAFDERIDGQPVPVVRLSSEKLAD